MGGWWVLTMTAGLNFELRELLLRRMCWFGEMRVCLAGTIIYHGRSCCLLENETGNGTASQYLPLGYVEPASRSGL
jgi:hypothetical protein